MATSLVGFLKGLLIQESSDRTKQLQIDVDSSATTSTKTILRSSQTSNRTLSLPDATDTLVGKATTDILTNKTIDGDNNTVQDLALTSLKTNLADASKFLVRDASGIVISNTKDVPTGSVVGNSDSQTLTNKTIDASLNTVTNVDADNVIVDPAGNLDSTNVQDALEELQSDIDAIVTGGGTGTVIGPVSSTDNAVVRWNGTTGINIQNSGVIVSDLNDVSGINDLDVTNDVSVGGDLDVTGTLTAGVFNPVISNQTITLNDGGNDASAENSGLIVDRDPGVDGSLLFDSTLASKWKAGLVGSEIQLANISSTQTFTNKTLTSPTITTPSTDVLNMAQSATPANPAAGRDKLYFKSDDRLYQLDSGGNEKLIGLGSQTFSTVTGNTTLTSASNNIILLNANAGAFTLTLPAANTMSGRGFTIKKIDVTTDQVTIDPPGAETLDGLTSRKMATQYETMVVVSDGSNWHMVDRKVPSEWVSASGLTTAGLGTPSVASYRWRRIGDSMEFEGRLVLGTTTGATATIALPSGTGSLTSNTIDTAKAFSNTSILGTMFSNVDGTLTSIPAAARGPRLVVYDSGSTGVIAFSIATDLGAEGTNTIFVRATGTGLGGSGDGMVFKCMVPISGWEG